MAYFKGQGGRPKGAKNKKTDLHAKCEAIGLDVFERMLEIAKAEPDTKKQWPKLVQLAQYLYAKPKDEGDIQLTPDQVREMIRQWTQDVQSTGS